EQHLKEDIGYARPHFEEALPWVLFQKAHRRVKCGAAPHFHREELRMLPGVHGCDLEYVVRAHARGEKRLMSIAARCVGEEKRLLFADPRSEFLGAEFLELISRTGAEASFVR